MRRTNKVLGPETDFPCTISEPRTPMVATNDETNAWRVESGIRKQGVKLKLKLESAEKDERVYKEKFGKGKDTNFYRTGVKITSHYLRKRP